MAPVQEPLVGRYELHELLGRGGMGVVYAGVDRILARPVAVKVLPAEAVDDPTVVTRFEREALAAAALSHPNIVSVYDTGRDETTRFIVMERVDGENLATVIARRGPLPVEEAVAIASQVASALGAAHAAGVVHRDVKPANLMLTAAGTVKVLDFGIARAAGSADLTRTAHILGSAAYMAPEVATGERAGAPADVYALGCVLYELLGGRPPFEADHPAAILHQHATRPPQSLRELRSDIPPALAALVAEMLAKDPRERPPSGPRLVAALSASTAPVPPTAHEQPTAPLPLAPQRSRFERAGLAVAVLLVAAGLVAAVVSGGTGGAPGPRLSPASTALPGLSPAGAGALLEQGLDRAMADVQAAATAAALAASTPSPAVSPAVSGPPPGHGPGHGHGHDHGGPPGHDGHGGGGD
jgi:serine/threonine protein kinase